VTHGLVLGKFYPPHAGHHVLIDAARAGCDQLTVAVLAASHESIPHEVRRAWVQERHPDVRVVSGIDDHPIDFADPAVHDLHADVIRALAGEPVDVFFSSEDYGEAFARSLGARHVLVDRERRRVPLSSTAVRADPAAHWDRLDPPVRAWFARRVAVVGAESTGTTTLARALAAHYRTEWVPEVGRAVSEERAGAGTFGEWRDADFEAIARAQQAEEDAAARRGGLVLICDTDALATCIWQERYVGRSTPAVEAIAASRAYDLYVLTGDDIPFVQDGLRDGEHLRGWMTERFRERLAERPEPHVEVRGSHEGRMAAAVAAIDALLARGWDLAEPWRDRSAAQPTTSRSTASAARSTSSATSEALWRQLPST
jgi:NadR type nicotinamide-nucleotide adenylyltransferase